MSYVAIKAGDKYNRWTFKEKVLKEDGKQLGWICTCDCGNNVLIKTPNTVTSGKSRSCGCIKKEMQSGDNNPMHRPEVAEKVRQKMLNSEKQKENIRKAQDAARLPEVIQKRIKTNIEKYGGNAPACSQLVKDKIKETNIQRLGVDVPAKSDVVKAKMEATNFKKYGTTLAMRNKEVASKVSNSLKKTLKIKSKYKYDDGLTLSEVCDDNDVLPSSARNLIYDGMPLDDVRKWVENHDNRISSLELRLISILNEAGIPVSRLDKKTEQGYRVDLIIDCDKPIYIEADGLHYHSSAYKKDKKYHFDKRDVFEKSSTKLFQFRQDEILKSGDVIVSMVSAFYGSSSKIGARKTTIKTVTQEESDVFFNCNHLMGGGINAKALGLFLGDELVSCISYKKYKDGVDISRFASKLNTQIQGGLSKLLNKIEQLESPRFIQSFVDLRYGDGHSLEKLGFKRVSVTLGWRWTDGYKTYNRLKCTANMDDRGLSEAEYAKELNWFKIYDAGQAKYLKYIKE